MDVACGQVGSASKRRGFTLIELLVVIAIVAILAAILFPVFASAKQRAQQTMCVSNLKELMRGFRLYSDDNDGRLPNARLQSWPPNWAGVDKLYGKVYPERGQIWKYVRNAGVFLCPSDRGVPAERIVLMAKLSGDSELEKYGEKQYPLSYAMNDTLYDFGAIDTLMMDLIPRHKEIMLLIHESRETISAGEFYWPPDAKGNPSDRPSEAHNSGTNLIYLDGHASWRSYEAAMKELRSWKWFPGYW